MAPRGGGFSAFSWLIRVTRVGGLLATGSGFAARNVKVCDRPFEHFRGEMGSMLKWFWFALEANFGNFLPALGKDLVQGDQVVELVSKFQNISTG